ncbi:bifunctional autolysin Atl [Bacillus sp. JCM 19046]|nr:bifunctional autolysin Atl [Bacillus sp. JCM 19046]
MLVTGTGNAYSKAWGGSKDLVQSLSDHRGAAFEVHLTERVGNSLWYRGTLNGKQMWIHSPHVTEQPVTTINYTPYHISLKQAVDRQFGPYAVTDQYPQYVSQEHVGYSSSNGGYYFVNTAVLNVRSGPGTNHPVVDQLRQGQRLSVRRSTNGWYQLFWVNAKKEDIEYYMNPANFVNNERQKFQFLDLTKSSGVTASILNNYLAGRGTLSNQGQAFIDAGRIHGINDIYLLSHALLETGHGTSTLARGNEYNGKTVYNMYGIGAIDSCPIECGTKLPTIRLGHTVQGNCWWCFLYRQQLREIRSKHALQDALEPTSTRK